MPNANYQKGRRLEYAWKKKLEEQGSLVFRTAGSHGLADLIEFRPRAGLAQRFFHPEAAPHADCAWVARLIQCKAGTPTKADREKLKAAKAKWGHSWFLATPDGLEEIT